MSEWDVVKKHHRFIRDDEEPQGVSWEERAARAYESKLFREYALVDLKHFKSKRFALRWRTATEVVKGIGEETCASLRCPNHAPLEEAGSPSRSRSHSRSSSGSRPFDPRSLHAFELPFVYEEQGARKECLVKVRLCRKCARKLEWKPEDDQRGDDDRAERRHRDRSGRGDRDRDRGRRDSESGHRQRTSGSSSRRSRSRSRSPGGYRSRPSASRAERDR